MTEPAAWPEAALAAVLCALDPAGLGGVVVRGRPSPSRERWLALLRGLLPATAPVKRLPIHADDQRVFGGLDLAATLAAGRPVAERGLLAEAEGGLLLISMAERMPVPLAGRLAAALDAWPRDAGARAGSGPAAAGIGLVAFDEGIEPGEQPPAALLDRLAFWITLDEFDPAWTFPDAAATLARTRAAASSTRVPDAAIGALCETAAALGIVSLRAPVMALRTARLLAALAGRATASDPDVALAARLVLAPRATRLPTDETPAEQEARSPDDQPPRPADTETDQPDAEDQGPDAGQEPDPRSAASVGELVLEAARAAIPAGLLDRLRSEAGRRPSGRAAGRAGAPQAGTTRGRPAGQRRGLPRGGARLDLIATLRAAVPWQRLRAPPVPPAADKARRLAVRRDDLRIVRFKQRGETTTILVVDASGSLVLNRLAEAKGAALLLLAECYVRRDEVALLAFRGSGADLILPPTRSLTRARRCLADLPGGGATPLASAIDAALALAEAVRRKGRLPVVVFLTDGRANVARDGGVGRTQAEADVRLAAAAAAATGIRMLVVDVAPRPQAAARALASAMRAGYLALPRAEADTLSRAVLAVSSA